MKACYEVFSNEDVVRLIIELSHVDPWHLCRLAKLGSAFREAVLDSDVVVLNALGRCRVLPKGLSRSAVMGFLALEWSAVNGYINLRFYKDGRGFRNLREKFSPSNRIKTGSNHLPISPPTRACEELSTLPK